MKCVKNDTLIIRYIHYYTLKINQTVILVKLFEKMFNMSSVVLDNRLKILFPFINVVIDESLRQRVSVSQLFQIGVAGKLSSTTALINGNNTSRNFIKNN